MDLATKYELCKNCLRDDHETSKCKNKTDCFKCHKRHHTLLHIDQSENVFHQGKSVAKSNALTNINSGMQILNEQPKINTHFSLSQPINHSNILLATARVWVLSSTNRAIRVRALLDPG